MPATPQIKWWRVIIDGREAGRFSEHDVRVDGVGLWLRRNERWTLYGNTPFQLVESGQV